MQRAYSALEIKDVNDGERIITGIASTPSTDRMGDIVEPLGADYTLPIPLLWQHDSSQPIGWVERATPSKTGIQIQARFAKIDAPGPLRDRLDEAWQSIKLGLVRGLSIGFRGLDSEAIPNSYGVTFKKWEWLELSAVTIPANSDASIQTIKAIDRASLAALGRKEAPVVRLDQPGASGSKSHPKPQEGKPMNVQEQIQQYTTQKSVKDARMDAIMTKSVEDGRTLDAAEGEEYDTLGQEVASLDVQIKRLKDRERSLIAGAKSVEGARNVETGSTARSVEIIELKKQLPKGTAFSRYVQTLAAAKGNLMQAAEIAKKYDDTTPEVSMVLRAAVVAGTTTDAAWAAPLVPYQNMQDEFIELLRPQTIIGKIPGLRRVPFNVKMPTQSGGSTVSWVGQTAPKPVSQLAFGNLTLDITKTAGIVVISEELARLSTPSAEAIIRQDLTEQIAQFLDISFINPALAAVAGVSPASITNGATVITASGTNSDAVRADINKLMAAFTASNLSTAGSVFVMTEVQATALSMMVNALGQPEFPGITANGGTLFGLPVITSQSVTQTTAGSPAVTSALIILIKASEVLLADDGGVTIDVSREASLQMDSAPTNPPVAATVFVSLWQMNLIGIRAERYINWVRRRPGSVAYITGAHYN